MTRPSRGALVGMGYLAILSAALLGGAAGIQYLWGGRQLPDCAAAVGLTAGPGLALVAADGWLTRRAGPVGAYAVGVAARSGIALFGGAVVSAITVPDGRAVGFWLWLLAGYLAALAIETTTLARAGRP